MHEQLMLVVIGGCIVAALLIVVGMWLQDIKWYQPSRAAKLHGPEVHLEEECIVCRPFITAPGVARVDHGHFIVTDTCGFQWDVPLCQVEVIREFRKLNSPGLLRRVFELRHPEYSNFGIAVRSPAKWRAILVPDSGSGAKA